MIKQIRKFIAEMRLALFVYRRNREIQRISDQLHGRKNGGFPFATRDGMNKQTQARDLIAYLALIEQQAPEMGEAYSDKFLYLMHRDVCNLLELHIRYIQQRIPRESVVPLFAAYR